MIKFLKTKTVIHINESIIRTTGGGSFFVRDMNLLKSALDKPKNLYYYKNEQVNFAELATFLILGITKNHPFENGNKRTALISLDVFCDINGYELQLSEVEAVCFMKDVAASILDQEEIIDLLKKVIVNKR